MAKAYFSDVNENHEEKKAEKVDYAAGKFRHSNRGFKLGLLIGSLGATAIQSIITIIIMIKMIF